MKRKSTLSDHLPVIIVLLWLLCGMPSPILAQEASQPSPWYGGVQCGVPFGVSTFSSFGADKTRIGFNAGVYGGYCFNSVLSAEVSAKWGKTSLSAQDCCIDKGYWLGSDGIRYNAPVMGMDGWDYSNLKSDVSLQQYGVQLNVNVLGFFKSTRLSRWTAGVSPTISAIGTKATVKTISGNAKVQECDAEWHLGVGGNLQVGYRVTGSISLCVYSGATYLTGKRMDGVPEYRHDNNYIWESGIRFGYTFNTTSK